MRAIRIEDRVYTRNPDVDAYQVPFAELGNLTIGEIPRQSHLYVLDIPWPRGAEVELAFVNGSSDDELSLTAYGGPYLQCSTQDEANRKISTIIKRCPDLIMDSQINPFAIREDHAVYVHLSRSYDAQPQALIRDIVEGYMESVILLSEPLYRVFICHASADKAVARLVADALGQLGNEVWFDEWEIRIGDSIVQKINEGISKATHLVVLLSQTSCSRPWVTKEWSAGLMRQLAENSVTVMPIRLDDHPIPAILADLRYADCRVDLEAGIEQIRQALIPS